MNNPDEEFNSSVESKVKVGDLCGLEWYRLQVSVMGKT